MKSRQLEAFDGATLGGPAGSQRAVADAIVQPPTVTEATLALFGYTILIYEWRRWFVWAIFAAVITAILVCKLLLTPTYQAITVIRTASQEGPNTLASVLGATGLGDTFSNVVTEAFGLQESPNDVQEETAILQSYAFNIALADRHHLRSHLLPPTWWRRALAWLGFHPYTSWALYKQMSRQFNAEYEVSSGDLTLSYVDPEPAAARRILGYYLGDLRAFLSHRETVESAEAIAELEQELHKTSDSVLITQLDSLIAQQLQQQMAAQMQATFAFTIIDPPIVGDEQYSPDTLLAALIVGVTSAILLFFIVLMYERVWLPQSQLLQLALAESPGMKTGHASASTNKNGDDASASHLLSDSDLSRTI